MIIKRSHDGVGRRIRLARVVLVVAAGVLASLLFPAATSTAATAFSSFDAGNLAPGQLVHKVWNNANSDRHPGKHRHTADAVQLSDDGAQGDDGSGDYGYDVAHDVPRRSEG